MNLQDCYSRLASLDAFKLRHFTGYLHRHSRRFPYSKETEESGRAVLFCFSQYFCFSVYRKTDYRFSFISLKHSLQYTGLSLVGWNGTLASLPHLAQTVVNISRGSRLALLRLSRHALHLCGSLSKPFSAKNSCSPAVNTNSHPQSLHVSVLSWNILIPLLKGKNFSALDGLQPSPLKTTLWVKLFGRAGTDKPLFHNCPGPLRLRNIHNGNSAAAYTYNQRAAHCSGRHKIICLTSFAANPSASP